MIIFDATFVNDKRATAEEQLSTIAKVENQAALNQVAFFILQHNRTHKRV